MDAFYAMIYFGGCKKYWRPDVALSYYSSFNQWFILVTQVFVVISGTNYSGPNCSKMHQLGPCASCIARSIGSVDLDSDAQVCYVLNVIYIKNARMFRCICGTIAHSAEL